MSYVEYAFALTIAASEATLGCPNELYHTLCAFNNSTLLANELNEALAEEEVAASRAAHAALKSWADRQINDVTVGRPSGRPDIYVVFDWTTHEKCASGTSVECCDELGIEVAS